MTPRSSNRAARPTPRTRRPGKRTNGSARSMRFSPRRRPPRQAHRLPPSSVRISRQNRQGWPSSHRMVGGSSSPSVRRRRSRPVLASRSTSPAWSLRRMNRRVPRSSLGTAPGRAGRCRPAAGSRAVAGTRCRAGGPRVHGGSMMGLVEQGQEQAVFGIILDVSGAGSIPPGAKRPPLAGRLALAASQVDDHLVMRLRGRDIQHVDQQPLGVAVDRLGAGRRLIGARPNLASARDPPIAGSGRRPGALPRRRHTRPDLGSEEDAPWDLRPRGTR